MVYPFLLVSDRPAQAHVGALQRTHDAIGHTFFRAVEHRNFRHEKFSVHLGWARHFHQVAQEAETREVGAGGRAVFAQALRAQAVRDDHGFERGVNPAAFGGNARMGREQSAGADGFGQNQHVAGLHAAFAQHRLWRVVDQTVHGKTQRQLFAFARVAAHQRAIGFAQNIHRARHHLEQDVFGFRFKPWRHGDDGGGRLRLAAHGPDVAQ